MYAYTKRPKLHPFNMIMEPHKLSKEKWDKKWQFFAGRGAMKIAIWEVSRSNVTAVTEQYFFIYLPQKVPK